ncbi:hypothetical protein B9Z19DRAFT_1120171 [Tuber borchii]|uniref:Uncharacterized protein n=1 Tax=Tuber borchii TaxID=42251 RepID=A0A2T7A4W1_TUBBO|nr:hypothetical protein B9Z19DRAFT_1120171 [Tuber borchii]
MAEPQANEFRTGDIITITFAIITAIVGLFQLFPRWRFWEPTQPILPITHQELRPVLVVNCIGQLNFQSLEHEADLERDPPPTPRVRKNIGRRFTEA